MGLNFLRLKAPLFYSRHLSENSRSWYSTLFGYKKNRAIISTTKMSPSQFVELETFEYYIQIKQNEAIGTWGLWVKRKKVKRMMFERRANQNISELLFGWGNHCNSKRFLHFCLHPQLVVVFPQWMLERHYAFLYAFILYLYFFFYLNM